MPKFLVKAQYSSAAFRGLIEDPADRRTTTEKLLAGAGVTLTSGSLCPIQGRAL